MIRAQCSGHQVNIKHRGPCKGINKYGFIQIIFEDIFTDFLWFLIYVECLESRSYAIAHRSSSPNKFVPRCRADGSYASVQCMEGAGCWCSDAQGKPIPNTTTTNGKPNCVKNQNGKSNMRRSPLRNQNLNRNKRACTRPDQRLFNSNLIKVFHSEYIRYHQGVTSASDRNVLEWKFSLLDINKNDLLDKIEYRELRRLVRKVVTIWLKTMKKLINTLNEF